MSSSIPQCGSKCSFLNNKPHNYGHWKNKSKCMDYICSIYQRVLFSYLWSKLLRKISKLKTLCVMQKSGFKRLTPTDWCYVWFRREIALKILLKHTYIPHPFWYLISDTARLYFGEWHIFTHRRTCIWLFYNQGDYFPKLLLPLCIYLHTDLGHTEWRHSN